MGLGSVRGEAALARQVEIAPSILSADFMNLQRDIALIEEGGAGFVHVDVMDGHFVDNLTIGVPHVKQLAAITSLPLDVHLMVSNPLKLLDRFLEAGADIVTIHVETVTPGEAADAIAQIHAAGARASLSLKPGTPVEAVEPFIADLDMVLVMSVEPGFSGQGYIEGSEQKVARIAEMAAAVNPGLDIEVDGGIGVKTAPLVAAAGANILVCGNAVYAAPDPKQAIASIKAAAQKAADEARL